MKKDTIYIDTEDDITSIIDKVKASSEKIIALVPPKRVGVLQSAVNLKLLQKSAQSSDKRIVIITTNKSLSTLAAGVSIPVAKNLQSKPELLAHAYTPEEDETEDIINGEDIPVGELEKTVTPDTDIEDDIELPEDLDAKPSSKGPKKSKAKKAGPNIPNFDIFRKKLFLIIGGGILLLVFLIWATFFAPSATISIKANTTTEDITLPVRLDVNATTDVDSKILKPTVQQIKKTISLDFDATGKKDVGEKATGTVTISNCATTSSISIPAGTAVSSDGLNFLTASAVSVPGGSASTPFGPCTIPGKASVSVQAQNVGENYNIASNNDFSVAGQGSSVSATNKNAFTGGSKRTVNVVADSDIETAKTKILQDNTDTGRKELEDKFNNKDYVVIDESYKADPTTVTSSPASGNEATKAKLTIEMTYTLLALDKDDASSVLNAYLKDKMTKEKNQKIYNNGLDKIRFESVSNDAVTFKGTGYIGPNIEEKKLKPQLVGKNYEEIRQKIKAVEGVKDVDTTFFPFWISTAPREDKIEIKFLVQNDE